MAISCKVVRIYTIRSGYFTLLTALNILCRFYIIRVLSISETLQYRNITGDAMHGLTEALLTKARSGDRTARDAMIIACLNDGIINRTVNSVLKKYRGKLRLRDDLIANGNLALVAGIESFLKTNRK